MSFMENMNLENILNRIGDLINNESDFKANFSKVRKRKSEKEERLFLFKFNQLLKNLIEYKDGRSMVHIFHLRFIHTNVHTKRSRIPKLIAIITEYLRLSNKSYNDHHTNGGNNLSISSSMAFGSHLTNNNLSNNSSPSLSSSSPNVIIVPSTQQPTSLSLSQDSDGEDNNYNNSYVPSQQQHNFGSSIAFTPLNKLQEQITTYNRNINQHDDVEVTNILTVDKAAQQQQQQQLNTTPSSYHSSPQYLNSSNQSSPPITISSPLTSLSPVLISQQAQYNNTQQTQEMKVAKELLDYLTTHQIDVDNSLVGCDVSPIYLDSVFRLRSQNSFSKRSLIKMIKSWASLKDDNLIKEVRKTSNSLNNLDFKKGELVIIEYQDQQSQPQNSNNSNNNNNNNNNFNNNNNNNNKDQQDLNVDFEFDFDEPNTITAATHSNRLSPVPTLNNNLQQNFNNDEQINNRSGSYIFARFEEEVINRTCKVYIIPTEDSKQLLSVSINNVYKISNEIVEAIKNEKFIELVSDPSKPFFHMLSFKEKQLFNEYIEKKGLDTSILDKCKNNTTSILDLPKLKHAIQIIGELDKNIQSTTLLSDVIKLARQESKPFLESAKNTCFYIPLYVNLVEIVKNIENIRETELRSSVQTIFISLDTFYYKVHLEKKEILDSTAKGKLSQWWLSLIKDTLNAFLTKIGFDFNAVPADYLDKPPQNLNTVKQNLDILHQLLEIPTLIYTPGSSKQIQQSALPNETYSQQEFKRVVIKLAETIYPMIDEFVLKSYLVILDSFDMFTSSITELKEKGHLKFEFVKSLIADKKDTIEKSKVQQLEKLLKDIYYCIEMKQLENVSQEKRLDIVTITGLVFGRVHRLENEMRTVIENWKHLETQPTPQQSNSHQVHKRAISSSNNGDSSKWSFSSALDSQQKSAVQSKFLLSQRKTNTSNSSMGSSNNSLNSLVVNNSNNNNNNNSNSSSASTSPSSSVVNFHNDKSSLATLEPLNNGDD